MPPATSGWCGRRRSPVVRRLHEWRRTGFPYRPGDEEHWYRVHLAADAYSDITPDLHAREFGRDVRTLAARQLYLVRSTGEVIGTGSAWWYPDGPGSGLGRVHWIAILPA